MWRSHAKFARRFNHIYGREPEFEQKVEKAIKSLGTRNSAMYRALRKEFRRRAMRMRWRRRAPWSRRMPVSRSQIAIVCWDFSKAQVLRYCPNPKHC